MSGGSNEGLNNCKPLGTYSHILNGCAGVGNIIYEVLDLLETSFWSGRILTWLIDWFLAMFYKDNLRKDRNGQVSDADSLLMD